MAQPAPCERKTYHPPINMEMPKFNMELTKQGLRLFIRRYVLWAAAKRLDEQASKLAFPLAFNNLTAQQYFLIHDADLMNNEVTWSQFVTKFVDNCPMEVTEHSSIFKILSKQQQVNERGSLYLQKMRYMIGQNFPQYHEKEVVSMMMEGLHKDLRHYLECRGTPLTYEQLLKNVQTYEDRGLQESYSNRGASGLNTAQPVPYSGTTAEFVPINFAQVTPSNLDLRQQSK